MKKLRIIALTIVALTMASCAQKYPDYEKTKGGAYYKIHESNPDGREVEIGDVVTSNLDYLIRDSLLFSYTQMQSVEPIRLLAQDPLFEGDLFEVMPKLHVGDSASIIVRADSTFIKLFGVRKLPPFVKNGDDIRFEIRVLKSQPREEFDQEMKMREEIGIAESDSKLQAYITENAPKAKEIAEGLYYEKTRKGWGAVPEQGDMVKVHYTGRLLDGTIFDSSVQRGEPIEFQVGWGRVIKGWDLGIAQMRKGEKGVLYIPCTLAYGPQGAGPIPPFSPLVFEVELVDIMEKE